MKRIDDDALRALLLSPRETLKLEIKPWLDLNTREGKAELALACLALRNEDGGVLVVGLDERDERKSDSARTRRLAKLFDFDRVQEIVSKYASESFSVETVHHRIEQAQFVTVSVPGGIRTPVSARASLRSNNGDRILIHKNRVYARSLASNGRVSTSEAHPSDLDRVVNHCFANREADIGGFLRRHLSAEHVAEIAGYIGEVFNTSKISAQQDGPLEALASFRRRSWERMEALCDEQGYQRSDYGFWEATVIAEGPSPNHTATRDFLSLLTSVNPRLRAWPMWLNALNGGVPSYEPRTHDECWEALLVELEGGPFRRRVFDFWTICPKGQFYQARALDEDFHATNPGEIGKRLNWTLPILRVGETLRVTKRFCSAMDYDPQSTTLHAGFRWTGLRGRALVHNDRMFGVEQLGSGPSQDDEAESYVAFALDAADSSLDARVVDAVNPLFLRFGGYKVDLGAVIRVLGEL